MSIFRRNADMFVAKPKRQLAHYTDLTMPRRDWSTFEKPPIQRGFVSERAPHVRATPALPFTLTRQAG